MDSLFVMQRYWGSDDESDAKKNTTISAVCNNIHMVSNKKLKLAIPVIEIDDQDDKFSSEEQVSDSSSNKILSENKVYRSQELESSIIKIDNSKDFDFSSKLYSDSEIKILQNSKNNNLENNDRVTQPKETFSNAENSISKKRKNHKSNKLETLENGKEVVSLENKSQGKNDNETFCTIGQIYHSKDTKIRHALPHWLCNPTYISVNLMEEDTPISQLNYLDSNTKKNLKDVGINFLFPVQLAVIPWLMQSKKQSLLIRPSDICVSAPTGSGKTLAFVLPIVQSLKDRVVCAIRALVVLPVNELAIQVYKVFETFIRGTDLKVALLTGQKSFIAEKNALVKSDAGKFQNLVDIVITTPGRLLDHIYRTKGFCLKHLRYLVIDEADRMMEEIQQGWLKEVEDAVFHDCITSSCVYSSFKRMAFESSSAFNFGFISQPLQKLLYSATLTHDPEQLYSLSLYKPKLFTTSSISSEQEYTGTCVIPSGLSMWQVICAEGVKPMAICHFIKHHNFKRVLCFTESIERAHRLHLVLEEMGILQVREISSFNRAVQRKIVLEQFSSGKINILVCSDLVARGIDIENIDCVISYDVPQFAKIYIHRIGRTARAGKTGTAITLLSEGEMPHFKKILTSVGIEMPEKVNINSEDLKPLVSLYKTALSVADAKLKKEKTQVPRRSVKKDKSK